MKKHGGPWIEVLKEIPVSVPGRGGGPLEVGMGLETSPRSSIHKAIPWT